MLSVTDLLFEMSNISGRKTGLPMIIYVSIGKHLSHGPRIKVSKIYGNKSSMEDTVSFTISDNPKIVSGGGLPSKDIKLVKNFIIKNKDNLLKHWNNEITSDELIDLLVKV
jgi:hypothetical protein